MVPIIVARTEDLAPGELAAVRALLDRAFGDDFNAHDWDHTLGGFHVLAVDGGPLAHAAVVERVLDRGDRTLRAGYVEGVATEPVWQGQGLGTAVMTRVREVLVTHYEVGALCTSRPGFYERLGWRRWGGPTYIRDGSSLRRTADEDDGLMVLGWGELARRLVPGSAIVADRREGDDW